MSRSIPTSPSRLKRSIQSTEAPAKSPNHTNCFVSGRNLINEPDGTCYIDNKSRSTCSVNPGLIPDVVIKIEAKEEDVNQQLSKRHKTEIRHPEYDREWGTTSSIVSQSAAASASRRKTDETCLPSCSSSLLRASRFKYPPGDDTRTFYPRTSRFLPPFLVRRSATTTAPCSTSKVLVASNLGSKTKIETIPYLYDPASFASLQGLLQEPSTTTNHLQHAKLPVFKLVLPYLLQRIKMWGGHLFSNEELAQLLNSNFESNEVEDKLFPSFSKVDFFNCLVNTVHPLVLKEIFGILILFPMTLPLVVKAKCSSTASITSTTSINTGPSRESYKVLIPLFRHCRIKWRRKNDVVQQNFLFSSNFKMLGTLIIGGFNSSILENQQQSQIINSAILEKNLFHTGDDDESPLTLAGTIEMVPLTEQTCNSLFWNTVAKTCGGGPKTYESDEILLLANLYGNALNSEFGDHVKLLGDLCSALIVFIVPDDDNNADEAKVQELFDDFKSGLQNVDDQNRVFTIIVSPRGKIIRYDRIRNSISISMGKLSSRQTNREILDIFQKAVQLPTIIPPKWLTKCDSESSSALKNLYFVEEIWTEDSMLLVKEAQNHPRDSAALSVYSRNNDSSSKEALRLCKNIMHEEYLGDSVQERVLYHFLRILNQPMELQQKSFSHLESALSQNSGQFLGMEAMFREIAAIYEGLARIGPSIENDALAQKYLITVPNHVARYFIEGGPIELFDGDKDQMNINWLKDIFQNVRDLHPNLKIFVISMLGVQSSGKSTLLNALFKCRFSVSAGRCTKGLFLQLIFLESDYAQKCGFDAILVIDTEGLESPDRENEKTLLERDRKMATFVASISNLVILNVLGESLRDISRILQIVVIALSSLKNAGLQPSSLMLVQHSNEKNSASRETTFKNFSKSIVAAINLVKDNPVEFGPYNTSTMDLWERSLDNTDLVHQFDSFKGSRGGVGAPPTNEYHEDVRTLYEKIMQHGTKIKPYSFNLWQGRIMETYKCINEYSKKDFAFQFKSIVEVQEFYQRAAKVSKIQQKLCQAHKDHVEDLKAELAALLDDPEYTGDSVTAETKSEMQERIYSKISDFFDRCSRPHFHHTEVDNSVVEIFDEDQPKALLDATGCLKCTVAVELFKQLKEEVAGSLHESQVLQTIQNYLSRLIKYGRNDLESHLEIEEIDRNSSELIRKRMADYLKEVLVGVDPNSGKEFDDVTKRILLKADRQQHIDRLFAQIKTDLEEYEPHVDFKRPIFDDLMMDLEGWINATVITKLEEQDLGQVAPSILSATSSFLDGISLKIFSGSTIYVNPLTDIQREELLEKLKVIPEEILEEKNLSINEDGERLPNEILEHVYERGEGLPQLFKTKVQNLIFDFGNKYDVDFEDVSILKEKALQIFLTNMYEKEAEWYKENSPVKIFSDFAPHYKPEMHVILKRGWNIQVAGELCGKLLLRLAKTVAEMRVKKEQKARDQDRISGLSMFHSIENARLAYFTELAKEMLNKKFDRVLKHFRQPAKSLKQWTRKKLEEFSTKKRTEFQRQYFKDYFNSLVADVRFEVQNATNFPQIRELERQLFKQTYSVIRTEIDIDLSNFEDGFQNFTDYKIKILAQFDPENISRIQNDVDIESGVGTLLRTSIGCTAFCKFCGAICWLDAGHERNSDDTRRHMTSHQPHGLMLFEEVETGELVRSTCYEIHEDNELTYGKRTRRWRDWKERNPGWIYSRQSHSEFDSLMLWIFVHLNKHLAKQHPALRPLNPIQIDRLVREKRLPNLNSILHSINIKIRERE